MGSSVGIRELRQNASAVVERVRRGESVVVTLRGVPAARLVPIRPTSQLDRLIEEGRARPARTPLAGLPKPLTAQAGRPSLSQVLAELRDEDPR
jgi:prevent-host-death family protein